MAGGIRSERVIIVVDHGAMPPREGIVRASPDIEPVGIGAQVHRAMIGVADREGVCQRILERQVLAREVLHGMVAL